MLRTRQISDPGDATAHARTVVPGEFTWIQMSRMGKSWERALERRRRAAFETDAVKSDAILCFGLGANSRMALYGSKERCAGFGDEQIKAHRSGQHTLWIKRAMLRWSCKCRACARLQHCLHHAMVLAVSPTAGRQMFHRRAHRERSSDRRSPEREHGEKHRSCCQVPHFGPVDREGK